MTNEIIKYMPLSTFIAYIAYQRIALSRITEFEDKYEGCPNFSSSDGALAYCRSHSLKWVSSWSAFELGESIAMWDLYAKDDGLAIVTTQENIKKNMNNISLPHNHELISVDFKKVNYEKSLIEGDVLIKRTCFRHEEEYRIVAEIHTTGHNCEAERLDPENIIFMPFPSSNLSKIIVSPRCEKWKFDAFKKLTNRFDTSFNIIQLDLFKDP